MSMPGTWTPDHPASGPRSDFQDTQTYIRTQLLSRRSEYLEPRSITIKVGSWNVASEPNVEADLKDWLVDKQDDGVAPEEIDIYAIGLQEVVDVNQTQTFLKYLDPKIAMGWRAHAQSALPQGYECIASPQLIGILLLVFVSPKLVLEISSIADTTVGTGLMGYIGNKGGVGVRLALGDTLRLVFINCHLAAFQNATERRNWDAAEIQRRMNFGKLDGSFVGLDEELKDEGQGLTNADVVLWCGDLNYRVDVENGDVRSLLAPFMPTDLPPTHSVPSPRLPPPEGEMLPPTPSEAHPDAKPTMQGTIESLMRHDQLIKQRKEKKAFVGYSEGKVTFLPSYKYDVGTVGVLDSSEKARAPSWCDRILWRVRGIEEAQEDDATLTETPGLRSRSTTLSSLALKDEILFETELADDDSSEEDLVVSRADSEIKRKPVPQRRKTIEQPLPFDSEASFTSPFGDIKLQQKLYAAYQHITSSDHKPIAAIFNLSYPASVPPLRSKIHAEITKEADRIENERRPIVTVIIDPVDDTVPPSPTGPPSEILEFESVRLLHRKSRSLTIANTGASAAKIYFVTRPSSSNPLKEVVAQPWLSVIFPNAEDPTKGITLEPGDTTSVEVAIHITEDSKLIPRLNAKKEVLDDVLILRVENGRDQFLPIAAKWAPTIFTRDLDELLKIPDGVGGVRGWSEKKEGADEKVNRGSCPRELYRLTEFLITSLRASDAGSKFPGWPFSIPPPGPSELHEGLRAGIWEAIDADADFTESCNLTLPADSTPTSEEQTEAAAAVLLSLLSALPEGLVPASLWSDVQATGGDRTAADKVLDKMDHVRANVFIYLAGVLGECCDVVIKKREGRDPDRVRRNVVEAVTKGMVRAPDGVAVKKAEEEKRRAFLRGFVEV